MFSLIFMYKQRVHKYVCAVRLQSVQTWRSALISSLMWPQWICSTSEIMGQSLLLMTLKGLIFLRSIPLNVESLIKKISLTSTTDLLHMYQVPSIYMWVGGKIHGIIYCWYEVSIDLHEHACSWLSMRDKERSFPLKLFRVTWATNYQHTGLIFTLLFSFQEIW